LDSIHSQGFANAEVKGVPAPKGFLSRELAFVIEKLKMLECPKARMMTDGG
jgi:hypothetical protein